MSQGNGVARVVKLMVSYTLYYHLRPCNQHLFNPSLRLQTIWHLTRSPGSTAKLPPPVLLPFLSYNTLAHLVLFHLEPLLFALQWLSALLPLYFIHIGMEVLGVLPLFYGERMRFGISELRAFGLLA
jgi:hypothetical protein